MTEPTVAAPPTTTTVASELLAAMAALSGVLTDYNPGSQIRTLSEAIGAVCEMEGIQANTLVFQGMVYGALALFNILPGLAIPSTVTLTFSTTPPSYPPVSQTVIVPAGTIVQTQGGIQFQTTTPVTLNSGSSSVNVAAQALTGGANTNVPAAAITQIVTGLNYPLFVTNSSPATGGADAQTLSQTLSIFSAKVASLPASSPVAIANAAIGVTASGTGETVVYSCLDEPWISAGSGAGSGVAGWNLYIDNGFGTASSGLIAAVNQVLGITVSGATNAVSGAVQYRDAGVPYNIYAVSPVFADVYVTGVVNPSAASFVSAISGSIETAVSGYFTLPFGTPAEQSQLSATISNAGLNSLSSLTVSLYASGTITPALAEVSGTVTQRVLLNKLYLSLPVG
ncbi:MAG: baseplate J/gp47 family protein [Patescibacteria group bacterium]|nr:baseplate J/gp47 family protein [Patescibacteria group bacterium]